MNETAVRFSQNFRSDPNLRTLAQDIAHGNCVLFLGAGISGPAGLPTWLEIESRMKTASGLQKDYGPLRTADCCREALGSRNFHEFLDDVFRARTGPTRLHLKLAKLPVKIFITTNYDALLEEALSERAELKVLTNSSRYLWPHVDATGGPTWVLKIHGCASNFSDGLVIGERDYLMYSDKYPHVMKCLANIFARHSILFVGYSLSDANVGQILFDAKEMTAGHSTNRYFVSVDAEPLMIKLFESTYGLRVLNILTDGAGIEDALLEFVQQLVSEFVVPDWFIDILHSLNHFIDRDRLQLNSLLSSVFDGFDSTLMIRLALRIEEIKGIRLPLARFVDGSLKIRELLQIIDERESTAK